MKRVDELGSSNSFSAPEAAWPGDGWWRAYGDAQLDALIEEALRGSPDLDLAQARLHAAMAAGSGRACDAHSRGDRQCPAQRRTSRATTTSFRARPCPRAGTTMVLATLNLSWELDFWGKNRAALAAAISEQRRPQVEVAQTRLILSTSVASAYAGLVHLYTLRDNAAETLAIRNEDRGLVPSAARFRSRDPGERTSGRGAAVCSAGRPPRDR